MSARSSTSRPAAFAVMGSSPQLGDAAYLLRWIRRKGLMSFSRRDAHYENKSRFRTVEDLEEPLRLLQVHGYIRMEEDPPCPGRARRRPSQRYLVKPMTPLCTRTLADPVAHQPVLEREDSARGLTPPLSVVLPDDPRVRDLLALGDQHAPWPVPTWSSCTPMGRCLHQGQRFATLPAAGFCGFAGSSVDAQSPLGESLPCRWPMGTAVGASGEAEGTSPHVLLSFVGRRRSLGAEQTRGVPPAVAGVLGSGTSERMKLRRDGLIAPSQPSRGRH